MVKRIVNKDILNLTKTGGFNIFSNHKSKKFDSIVNKFSNDLDKLLNKSIKDETNSFHYTKQSIKDKYELQRKDFANQLRSDLSSIDEDRKKKQAYINKLKKQKNDIIKYIRNAYDENPLAAKVVIMKQLDNKEKPSDKYGLDNIEKFDLDKLIRNEFEKEKANILNIFNFKKVDDLIQKSNQLDNVFSKVESITKESISKFTQDYSKYLRGETLSFIQKSLDQSSISKTYIANIIYSHIQLNEKLAKNRFELAAQKRRKEELMSLGSTSQSLSSSSYGSSSKSSSKK